MYASFGLCPWVLSANCCLPSKLNSNSKFSTMEVTVLQLEKVQFSCLGIYSGRYLTFLKLVMFYKILHDLVEITFSLFNSSTRGHSQRFTIPFARTDTYSYLNSFSLLLSNYGIHALSDFLTELGDLKMTYPHTSSLD